MAISKFYEGHLAEKLTNLGNLRTLDNRRTGKTTGNAMELIGVAMQSPNQIVSIDRSETSQVIKGLIETLKLEFFTVSDSLMEYAPFMTDTEVQMELLNYKGK